MQVQRFSLFKGQIQNDAMRKVCLLFAIIFSIISCQKSSQAKHSNLVGKWKLTESYMDPGDGSGVWQAADPAHPGYIEFKSDGTLITTPYNIYAATRYKTTSDSTVLFIRETDTLPMRYNFSKTLLVLYPPCDEGCGQKYIAVH